MSYGKLLHQKGMSQGSCFPAEILSAKIKTDLCNSRVNFDYRNHSKEKHKILDDDCFVVLSQECDIACPDDNTDPLIELALFKPIKEQKLSGVIQFAKNVRKIQVKVNDKWYESLLLHVSWISKKSLWDALSIYEITKGDYDLALTLAKWRGNRYTREPLPDSFNEIILPRVDNLMSNLGKYKEKIISMHVHLNTYDETDDYVFDIFALTESLATDDELTKIMEIMEEFSYSIEESSSFVVNNDCLHAVRSNNINVNKFLDYREFNLDYVSLANN